MEKELGVNLFKRTRQGVILTPDGEKVLESTKAICSEVQKIQNTYFKNVDNGMLSELDSFNLVTSRCFLPEANKLLKSLFNQCPSANISLIQAEPPFLDNTDDYIRFVNSRLEKHDVIFMPVDDYNMDSIASLSTKYTAYSLESENLCLEVPKASVWAKRKSVAVRELQNIPLQFYGVNSLECPFNKGILERHYNIKLESNVISNVAFENETNNFFKENFSLLRFPHGFQENAMTCLIPLQEKCKAHHVVLLSNIQKKSSVVYDLVMIFLRRQFPNLFQIN